MKKIWQDITSFFKPGLVTFYLKADESTVAKAVEKYIKEHSSRWFSDIEGSFVINGNFEFYLVSPVCTNGARLHSKFKGVIETGQEGKAVVKAKLKPAPSLYIFILISLFLAIKSIIMLFYQHLSIADFLFPVVTFAIPFFIYHVSNASTIDRFKSFLRKEKLV
jgi:hypothetical protein